MFALITNACRYAGPHATKTLLESGYTVYCHDKSFSTEEGRKSFLEAYPKAATLNNFEADRAVAEMLNETETIDVLFNNHFVLPESKAFTSTSDDEFLTILDALVVEPYRFARGVLKVMQTANKGRIVFMTSAASLRPSKNVSLYTAARSAANSMVETLAKEVGSFGVSVTAIAPNFYVSDDTYSQAMFDSNERFRNMVQKQVPLERLSKDSEMESLIKYLTSEDSAFITGQILSFSGGWV